MPLRAPLKPVALACLALGVVLLAAGPAGAREVRMYESKVTLQDGPPAFHGKVRSDHGPCQNQRHVAVFRVRPGDDRKLGGDTTGPAGRWEVEVMLSSGAYYARVRKKEQIVNGNGYSCGKDRSRVVVVD